MIEFVFVDSLAIYSTPTAPSRRTRSSNVALAHTRIASSNCSSPPNRPTLRRVARVARKECQTVQAMKRASTSNNSCRGWKKSAFSRASMYRSRSGSSQYRPFNRCELSVSGPCAPPLYRHAMCCVGDRANSAYGLPRRSVQRSPRSMHDRPSSTLSSLTRS